ncbi:tetratricopeptide repeat protein [Tenacibaculum maritimum]|uniref:tetratricopeptide repeat protein n=1 Tax=Tenacibaculum maritimum TaxID=107401 RepID=UPI0012E680EC|nr:tetratricopeptide repeat protein [Tenacibaculum maritimum]CAA0237421.1 Protein of unknown function precursor [Tenacibaculum maritimum]
MKKQILTLSLGFMSIGLMAQKSELKTADKSIRNKDFAGAITVIESLKSSIGEADAKYQAKYYYLRGKAFAGKKDYKEAAKAFNDLMAFEKKSGKAKYTKEAAPMLNEMIQEVSQKAIGLYNNDKDYKNAAENFYLTYLLSPTDTAFAFNAAISASQAKDYDKALEYYKELKEKGYTGIAVEYLATNKVTRKVENLGSKTQRDLMVKTGQYIKPENKTTESKHATIVKNIALILKEQGKTDEAIAALVEARKANPKDLNLLLNEADMYIQLKQMDKFGKLMEEAVKMDPNNPTLYYNLGVTNYNQGRVKEAKDYYKKAIELNPEYSDAYMNLAVATLEKDKAIVEEMNKNLSNFKKYDALALQQKEVYKEALPYLEKADSLKRSIDTVKTLMNLYEVLEVSDKAKKYREIYQSMK